MNRRALIKQAGLSMAAFAMSRDLFAETAGILAPSAQKHNLIYLQSNENPYGPSKSAQKAMLDAVLTTNRYQWAETGKLVSAIAKCYKVTEKNVLLGAGSSELLGLTSHYASFRKGHIIAPDPTFRIWTAAAEKMNLSIKWIPLTAAKDTDLKAMLAAIDEKTSMVYVCNPNNPTGIPIPDVELRAFIKEIPKHITILMDEAYTEFEDTPSTVDMIGEYPNLVIAKTFSKVYGLAGARVGYVLAHESIIEKLSGLQPWKNASASAISVAAALASIQDLEFIAYCKSENAKSRAIYHEGLKDLGLKHTPSITSFTYFDTANYSGNFSKVLEDRNIVGARSFEKDSTWMRLSVGTVAEMTEVVRTLKSGTS
ncbi:pyridoxal phosphate-dependent aminotransferase [Sphingobacterium corticis]|uniref:Pyridoxal phosphate-dependent aminotransferase n=1 Tax=Sphingobacterium corticis TaxID=1812823 RepID=A0ABW5NM32_9SPHI